MKTSHGQADDYCAWTRILLQNFINSISYNIYVYRHIYKQNEHLKKEEKKLFHLHLDQQNMYIKK